MNLSSIDKVEDLHQHKGIKDECKMPGVIFCCVKCSLIVRLPTYSIKSATANSTTWYTIEIFVL